MATHSSILAWRIPWSGEPGSLGSQRVGHDWSDLSHTLTVGTQQMLFQTHTPTLILRVKALFHSFFYSQVVLHCINVPYLLYLCRWTFRLLPFLGYCKQHCNEYSGACIRLDYGFLWLYACLEWDCWRDKSWAWDEHMATTVCKTDNQQGPTA